MHPAQRLDRPVSAYLSLLVFAAFGFFSPLARGQDNSGNALTLNGTDFVRADKQLSGIFPDDNIAFEFWFRAAGPGALVGEADSLDIAQWDVLLAEILPSGGVIVGFPGVSPVIAGTIQFNTWHHLTFLYDDSAKILTAFLDNNPSVSSSGDRVSPRPPRDANYTFGRGGPVNLGPGGWFTGEFDEVRIWKIAPAETFLRLHWNRFIAPSTSGLAAMWHFDVPNGAFSSDSTANNNPALYAGPGNIPLAPSTAPILPMLPSVETLPALIESFSATLRGVPNPNGQPLSGYFEWGSTTSYGNVTPTQDLGSGNGNTNFLAVLPNLPKGEYHFRAVAAFSGNLLQGADQMFAILGPATSAATLDGTNYFRASRQSTAIFDADDFTFEFWFNATAPGVLLNEVDSADATKWDVALAEIFPNGKKKTTVPGLPTMELGNSLLNAWHHLALVYDVNAQALRAYIDGQLAGEEFGGRFTPKQAGRVANYAFGRGGPTNLLGGSFFTGFIDEVRIWKRPLSSLEIATAYNLRILTFESALKAYWRFDIIQSNSSPDATTNNTSALYVGPGSFPIVPSSAPVLEDLRPFITNLFATNINPEIARLTATIDTRNELTRMFVEYSRSNVVFQTVLVEFAPSSQSTLITTDIRGLVPGGAYDLRVVASNRFGQVRSPSISFQKLGWAGYAMRFASPDYLRTSAGQNTNFSTDSITIELWAKPNRAGVIVSESNFPNTTALDRSVIEILTNGVIAAAFDGIPTINLGQFRSNQWDHIALRYDATTQTLDGFLNGAKTASASGNRVTPAEKGIVGYFAFGKTTLTRLGAGGYFGGEMDEIRVWNIPRSDSEIALNRQAPLTGAEPGLILCWRLYDLDNVTIFDASPKNNRGQILGADRVISGVPLERVIAPIRLGAASELRLQFLTNPAQTFRLEKSGDLINWTPVATNTPSSFGVLEFATPLEREQPATFFRASPIASP